MVSSYIDIRLVFLVIRKAGEGGCQLNPLQNKITLKNSSLSGVKCKKVT